MAIMNEDEYKKAFVKKLIDDLGISQALLNTNADFKSTSPSMIDRLKMKDTCIFDYPLDTSIETEANSFIMMAFDFTYKNVAIDNVNVAFKIYVNQSIQKTDEGVGRNEFIRSRIKELFNKNKEFGIGGLILRRNTDLPPVDGKYIVSQMSFSTYNFS